MEYNQTPKPGLSQFWGSACKIIYTWMILHFFCVRCKKRKKKRSTYRPSQFSGQKGKQTFYFFRTYGILLSCLLAFCCTNFTHISWYCIKYNTLVIKLIIILLFVCLFFLCRFNGYLNMTNISVNYITERRRTIPMRTTSKTQLQLWEM